MVILIGDNSASNIYVKNKQIKANEVGIKSIVKKLETAVSEKELLDSGDHYNQDNEIDGILVQLPLPSHINSYKVIDAISYEKDVDGS